ncbi:hypothetical protein BOTCAL_0368g00050 [Botryotinia calthae]|uniref:Uncharacterized protein n=1 Tax=Botryotinia calthae TaxID=38488 RepID=A0A4Y8CST4_9HELO|nr:hypothetical protein BOTCAL_0368g00050 [Botryotinia calthae]
MAFIVVQQAIIDELKIKGEYFNTGQSKANKEAQKPSCHVITQYKLGIQNERSKGSLEEEQDFINRGVPNIGLNSKFWLPGYPEIHSMELEIHG